MTQTELLKMIGSGAVRDLDLTGRELKNIDFKGCRVENVTFDECTLTECNFDGCGMERVSFRKAVLRNCRFRRAKIAWSDFRYCEIERATFEEAEIRFCDLYRAMLTGIVIMRKARIGETSLYYAYFGEGVNIRRENIAGGRLLQQDLDAYRQFLIEWNTSGTGVRRNDRAEQSAWSPDAALHARWADAEEIYKNFNGLWTGIGFLRDANWAYVKGRRMERRRMLADWRGAPLSRKPQLAWKIATNTLMDIMFGYGESLFRMVTTYVVLVLFFAYVFQGKRFAALLPAGLLDQSEEHGGRRFGAAQRHIPAGRHAQRRPDDDRHPAHRYLRLHPRQQDTQSVKAVFTLRQYLTTLADTHGLTRTLGEIEVCRDGKGRICYSAGNSAVVFRIRCEGRVRSLRCYMHHPRHLAEIYGGSCCRRSFSSTPRPQAASGWMWC